VCPIKVQRVTIGLTEGLSVLLQKRSPKFRQKDRKRQRWRETKTERERQKKTARERHRERDRKRQRQQDRQRDTEMERDRERNFTDLWPIKLLYMRMCVCVCVSGMGVASYEAVTTLLEVCDCCSRSSWAHRAEQSPWQKPQRLIEFVRLCPPVGRTG